MRWLVECVWSGYRSNQSRPCHRKVIRRKAEADALAKINTVQFTDGTTMSVAVRKLAPRERATEINGYTSLLNEFRWKKMTGFVTVDSLHETPEEASVSAEVAAIQGSK